MRRSFSTYGSRGGVAPAVAVVMQPGALGGEVRVCAPRDCTEAGKCECDAPVATAVMPTGGWR
jgi:hypothetical protein